MSYYQSETVHPWSTSWYEALLYSLTKPHMSICHQSQRILPWKGVWKGHQTFPITTNLKLHKTEIFLVIFWKSRFMYSHIHQEMNSWKPTIKVKAPSVLDWPNRRIYCSLLFSLFSMTPLGNTKNVVLSRCRLLVNMTNGLKLSY